MNLVWTDDGDAYYQVYRIACSDLYMRVYDNTRDVINGALDEEHVV